VALGEVEMHFLAFFDWDQMNYRDLQYYHFWIAGVHRTASSCLARGPNPATACECGFLGGMTAMRAFEVHLNGKRLCVAGVGDQGVLTANISQMLGQNRNELRLEVGGLSLPFQEYLTWNRQKLKVGDEIRIMACEASSIDRPKERIQQVEIDPKEEIRNQKRYVREMARKFGWKIVVEGRASRSKS
jgi:hypothetical protein